MHFVSKPYSQKDLATNDLVAWLSENTKTAHWIFGKEPNTYCFQFAMRDEYTLYKLTWESDE